MTAGLRYLTSTLALLLIVGSSAFCDQYDSPFVSGFDRFARHGDIERQTGGQLLLSELSCTACHATTVDALRPKLGPRLNGAGDRLRADWVRRFLAAPQAAKPGTTMPDMLASLPEAEKEDVIDALVTFLSKQHESFPELKASGAKPVPHEFWHKGDPRRGRQLYHQIGCVACHEPDASYETAEQELSALDRLLEQLEPEEIEAIGLTAAARAIRSVPLGDVKTKYTAKSLTFFLLNPEQVRPSGRMPSLKLAAVEAADVAAFLLGSEGSLGHEKPHGHPPASPSGLQERGRRLFHELNCANCHSANASGAVRMAKPLAALRADAETTCFAGARPGLPHFRLDQEQSDSIRSALSEIHKPSAGGELSAKQQTDLYLLRLNCYACHLRDERGGVGRKRKSFFETVGHVDLGDEGRLPPPLTGVGDKLQKSWINKVLDGTGDVRPHMLARMPKFGQAATANLANVLAQVDGPKQPSEAQVFGDLADLAEPGRAMLNAGCVQCHLTRGESPPGVVGVDLAGIANRLYPQWFHDFLLDPERLKHGTRMPTFFPGGNSSVPDVLEGNVDRQIAAMWSYLKDIDTLPLPEKVVLARSQAFELIPRERPLILRTFMEHAGTHAIAVGFPEKVHFAFDAESVRLAQAWRGRFIDAYGTWFVRTAPPAVPLGTNLTVMPAGVPLALLKDGQQPWPTGNSEDIGYQFMGYRLDRTGIPTFLYRIGQFDIEDRIEPSDGKGLVRRVQVKDRDREKTLGQLLWFRMHVGKSLQRTRPCSYANEAGLTVGISEAADQLATLRELNGQAEWLLPVAVDGQRIIEVEYQW